MFVKSTKSGGREYVQIVKSVRKDGNPRHEVIANLGRADRLTASGLENLIIALQTYVTPASEPEPKSVLKDLSGMRERERVNYGYLAYRSLWQQFGLSELLQRLGGERAITYDYARIVQSLVLNHLLTPSSKRQFFAQSQRYFGLLERVE